MEELNERKEITIFAMHTKFTNSKKLHWLILNWNILKFTANVVYFVPPLKNVSVNGKLLVTAYDRL